jgi:hypothetical protein
MPADRRYLPPRDDQSGVGDDLGSSGVTRPVPHGEICDLPVEEWGKPYWGGDAVYAAATDDENPYRVSDVDADEPPF